MTIRSKDKFSKIDIKQGENLKRLNTLGLSSVASKFVEITSPEQLEILFKNRFFEDTVPFILGGGSNVLLKKHLDRPVVKVSIPGIDVVNEDCGKVTVKIGAGEKWHDVVTWAVNHGLGGIENLALIPGTTGAAPIQNIGAYGVEFEQVFEELELFDLNTGTFQIMEHESCNFGYRDSIFKGKLKDKVVITSVTLVLYRDNYSTNTEYASLSSYLKDKEINTPGIKDIFEAVIAIRQSKLPDPEQLANAGSFFKNPIITKKRFQQFQNKYHEAPFYQLSENEYKIPAGWLIEKAGWKGKRIGNVGTYENQALVLVNYGKASGKEIFDHVTRITKSVKEMFGIILVPEVNIVE